MSDPYTNEFPTQHLSRPAVAADEIRERTFPVAVRGYDRQAVDAFVEEMARLVGELEGLQSRESVIQRALDQVGEETAGILQRAHETADEIAARSRAQAEGRIARADREAEITRREADAYAEQVIVDTRLLWEERKRLIEDVRQLADEVLATADDAIERVKLPEPLLEAEAGPEEPAESPTRRGGAGPAARWSGSGRGRAAGVQEQPPPRSCRDEALVASRRGAARGDVAEDEPPGGDERRATGTPPGTPVPGTQPQTPAGGAPQPGLGPPEAAGEPSLYDTRKPTPGNGS